MSSNPTQKKKSARDQAALAGAKVPEDRAAKAEAKDEPIDVTITIDGIDEPFSFTIDPDDLDDDEALEAMAQARPALMFRNLTGDREEEFVERLRDERGRVRTSRKVEFVMAAMEALKLGKS